MSYRLYAVRRIPLHAYIEREEMQTYGAVATLIGVPTMSVESYSGACVSTSLSSRRCLAATTSPPCQPAVMLSRFTTRQPLGSMTCTTRVHGFAGGPPSVHTIAPL